jgi:predicted nucleic acid-binding protein
MSLYMDSCSIIEVAKYKMDMTGSIDAFERKEPHILACIALLEAAERGEIDVLTANLTNSECQHLDGLHDEEVRRLFRSLLTSGKVIKIVTDSVFISERAQELRWTYGINLRGADAHHLATAIESGCEEFITFDDDFLGKQELIAPLIRVIEGHRSNYLPSADQPRPVIASEPADSDEEDNLLFNLYEDGEEENEG